MRKVRTVEQGMGRSVRGEKDFSVIVMIGPDVTRLVRDKVSRRFLSPFCGSVTLRYSMSWISKPRRSGKSRKNLGR